MLHQVVLRVEGLPALVARRVLRRLLGLVGAHVQQVGFPVLKRQVALGARGVFKLGVPLPVADQGAQTTDFFAANVAHVLLKLDLQCWTPCFVELVD